MAVLLWVARFLPLSVYRDKGVLVKNSDRRNNRLGKGLGKVLAGTFVLEKEAIRLSANG
jgi:hypothetical protein